MKSYQVDTNIIIYAFLGKEPYASRFSEWVSEGQLRMSGVSIAEFLADGSGKDAKKFERLVNIIGYLPVDYAVSAQAAVYRKKFASITKPPFLLDCIVAATAKVHGCILVTHNPKDFPMKDIHMIQSIS